MARTAFVTLEGGAFQTVTDYVAVQELLVSDWQDGGNYRDQFDTPFDTDATAANRSGLYFPADGSVYVNLGSNPLTARLSDEVTHEPPRAEARQHTRLRFYAALEYEFTANASTERLSLPAAAEANVGDSFAASSTGTLPAGMSAGTVYYVIERVGNTVKLSTTLGGSTINITDAGTGTHTLHGLARIADFKPGEWLTWSNARPVRF